MPDRSAAARLVDPVCGMSVKPDSPHHAMHDGHDHRFCSAGCRTKFVADPARYLAAPSAAGSHPHGAHGAPPTNAAAAGIPHTCPMHPQIVQDGPGICPLCGMALEPVMPSFDDDENPELRDFSRRFWWTLPRTGAVFVLAMFGAYLPWPPPALRKLRHPSRSETLRSFLDIE